MEFSDILSIINPELEEVERELEANIKSPVPLVYEISKYLLGSGGKRLRPSVLLLSSGACGLMDGKERIYSAAALELIHTATLLHDDVVDESALRRGRPAANTLWGNKPSVLVGDFLFARAFQLMVETGSLTVLDILANAAAIIAEGEVMQLRASKNLATSEKDYLAVITAKTAALFAAASEAGSVLANADTASRRALSDYGHNLGVAFQLVDDALDYSGRQAVMGKS
ncbi:MAG: polyprenyl synthetase family protein, partial [Thermodesulfobacteriota bacterium]